MIDVVQNDVQLIGRSGDATVAALATDVEVTGTRVDGHGERHWGCSDLSKAPVDGCWPHAAISRNCASVALRSQPLGHAVVRVWEREKARGVSIMTALCSMCPLGAQIEQQCFTSECMLQASGRSSNLTTLCAAVSKRGPRLTTLDFDQDMAYQ